MISAYLCIETRSVTKFIKIQVKNPLIHQRYIHQSPSVRNFSPLLGQTYDGYFRKLQKLGVKSPKYSSEESQAIYAKFVYGYIRQLPKTTLYRQSVTEAFPHGLPYIEPKPLLGTSGLQWEYQAGPDLLHTLRDAIKDQYKHFQAGHIDKMTMPLYLFLSGAGTGKSRNATEFHRTAVECLGAEDEKLKNKLRNAWVFHVSFENGTSLRTNEQNPFNAIGSRMLLQLLPEKDLSDIKEGYEAPNPLTVLRLVAKYKKQSLKDATIILVVDGMQNLMVTYEDGLRPDSQFYKTMASIADLAHIGAFLLPCCTATFSRPIDQALKPSNRKRIYLPVASLEPPTIRRNNIIRSAFQMDNTAIKILVGDCGGHGRAMELLWDITNGLNLNKCGLGNLMRRVRDELAVTYATAIPEPDVAQAIVRAVVVHQKLAENQYIPNTKVYPDQVVAPGLIRYQKTGKYGYLDIPYIWLWVIVEKSGGTESLLPGWEFDDYKDILAKEDRTMPSGCSWENFEKFNMKFRHLKSLSLEEGSPTKISEIHHGAELKGDISFKNHHLNLAKAMKRTKTYTTKDNSAKWIIHSTQEPIDIRQHRHIILNADSAETSDVFLSLDAQPHANEVHQFKCYSGDTVISQTEYDEERKKATSNQDFFILFTTQEKPCNIKLSDNSGIVHRQNWQEYYGPFALRAYVYAMEGPLNINRAGYMTLQLVDGIGPVRADKIIEMRPFSSIEDAIIKTNISRKFLERFHYGSF